MALKPMLEFTNFPPRAEERPRRRRRAVKTPKILKVRCVTIASHNGQRQTHPSLETESQIRNGELEIAKGAKWISPQFADNPEATSSKTGKRQRLDLGDQLFPGLQPSRIFQRKKLNLSLKRKEGSARTRAWKRCGAVSTSQHVTLFPSAPSLPEATQQHSPLASAVANPSPPCCHHPFVHANMHSVGNVSANTGDLHNRAFERGSPSTDSGDAPIQSTADGDSFLLEISSDTTYLEDESSNVNGYMLKTAKDSIERCSTTGEDRASENSGALGEVGSHYYCSSTKQTAHTSDEDSTGEDSSGMLQAMWRPSEPCLLARLTTGDIHSPIGTQRSYIEGEFGTTHNTSQEHNDVHMPSHPLTPLAPAVSKPQATQPLLSAECIQNAGDHQQDACAISCFENRSGVCSNFTRRYLSGVNTPADLYRGNNDASTRWSESPGAVVDGGDRAVQECREMKKSGISVGGNLNVASRTSQPSCYQHHQSSRAASSSPQSVNADFQGIQDVIQDSVDSTQLPSLRLEENKSMDITATVCDLQRFQPQSFSTPFQSTDESSDASGFHSNLHSNKKSRRHEQGSYGDALVDNSTTRLDSHWALNHSSITPSNIVTKVGGTTPSLRSAVFRAGSTQKSILKKRNRNLSMSFDCNGQASSSQHLTGKGITKCVTFNLSCNSSSSCDESCLLAEDTPVNLWCSIDAFPPNRDEDEIKERVMDSEDACAGSCGEEVEKNMVCENRNNWHSHCCLDDMCILAMDTPVHMWSSPSINFIDDTFNNF